MMAARIAVEKSCKNMHKGIVESVTLSKKIKAWVVQETKDLMRHKGSIFILLIQMIILIRDILRDLLINAMLE